MRIEIVTVMRMLVLQVLENKKNRRINERKKHPPEWQQHFPRTSPPSWKQFLDKLGAGFTGGVQSVNWSSTRKAATTAFF